MSGALTYKVARASMAVLVTLRAGSLSHLSFLVDGHSAEGFVSGDRE